MKILHRLAGMILLLLVSVPGQAGELSFITIEVAPWAEVTADGKMVGLFPEVIREIEQRTGLEIAMSLTPFARVDRELRSGKQDCTILAERDESFVKIGPLVSYHAAGVIAREGIRLESYEDLAPLTISVLRGASIAPRFDADESLKKEFDTDYLISLRKIAHGRLDAVAGAMPTIWYLAEQEGLAAHLGEQLLLADVPLLLQCSRRSPNLDAMPALSEAVEAMKADGTLDKIKSKYHF